MNAWPGVYGRPPVIDAAQLMSRYCDGEARAFRDLYALVSPGLYGYLLKIARTPALAADLLQHTFLKVHTFRRAYIRGADPLPWIYAIAHRTFLDEMRRQRRDVVGLAEEVELDHRAGVAHAEQTRAASADAERVTATLSALARLPHDQREAVVLTKLEGKSLAEAAAITGASVTAMKVRAHRGYKALRGILSTASPALVSRS